MEVTSTSTEQTQELAIQLSQKLKSGDVLALYGNLGSGKTTFTGYLVKALGGVTRVQSPTFVIARKYKVADSTKVPKVIYHLDLYRLKSTSEVADLDLHQFFEDKEGITIIEWPEIAEEMLPENSIKIRFEYLDDTTRKIYVENTN